MRIKHIILAVIVILLLAVLPLINLFGEYWWFIAVNYENVFLTILFTSIVMGGLFALGFFVFAVVNVIVATRMARKKGGKRKTNAGIILVLALIALFLGSAFARWDILLAFLNAAPFQAVDPVFGIDIGFYAFQLPFLDFITTYLFTVLFLTILFTIVTHAYHSKIVVKTTEEAFGEIEVPSYRLNLGTFVKKTIPHLSILVGLVFFVIAYKLSLVQYGLLFSQTGVAAGASYTDLTIFLPLLVVLSALAALLGILFILNVKWKKVRILKFGIIAFIIITLVGVAAGGVTQAFIVQPDEVNVERPYIERTIQHTLRAYGLDEVEERVFSVSYDLTEQDIRENDATIRNIRLWDYRPLTTTFDQLQLFRTYYEFPDVDIDRYQLNGDYKQIMMAVRELNLDNLPPAANTWVNNHLVYTHGYGVVMNPVDRATTEGLPELFIKDIPPQSEFFDLQRPEIYYGERNRNYIITETTTDELDYPSGDENIYAKYAGAGGLELDAMKRFVYAVKFGSIEFLVSNSIQPESKVLLYRNIHERVRQIAPFLTYDPDPYVVLSEGRLFWIMDAYTISGNYPYSEPVFLRSGGSFNYIRNPVKVVIDAYNGDVTFYLIDQEDPVIQTYQNIFPDLFTDFAAMPEELKEHIRYPEGLFRIQAELYSTFHMREPQVFYNKEDVWVQPEEVYRGDVQEMEPYYIITTLPGEEQEEFILMQPFTPKGKQNMIAWMAGRSDSPHYGDITVFRFSKQELIYGPLQIEARIDQDTEISQLFTLWSQSGSSVLRGNTLVIPIEDSIMYIEPVYIEATEKGTLPQLKRVIVAYGDMLTMQPTLEEALRVIFGEGAAQPLPGEPGETPTEALDVLAEIARLYEQAQEALQSGDLAEYAQLIERIGELVAGY